MISSIKPKNDDHLFVGLDVFTNFYLFLSVANPKLFRFDFQDNFRFATTGKNKEWVKPQKSTNNQLSCFGLIEDSNWRNWLPKTVWGSINVAPSILLKTGWACPPTSYTPDMDLMYLAFM